MSFISSEHSPHLSPSLARDLLQTATAADFYSAMARLSDQLRKAHIMSSAEFMQVK